MFEKVLVALDFSVYSQKILDRISEIPGIQEVILVHIVDTNRPARLDIRRPAYRKYSSHHGREKKGA
jgi:hypothetical protein